mmetsp:Transcript_20817/g.67505  ORF Transcript_20817/g.67505 Transcript_20817/m.67505 type:complete len:562 (+) Transcript_20817:90-1775(+)
MAMPKPATRRDHCCRATPLALAALLPYAGNSLMPAFAPTSQPPRMHATGVASSTAAPAIVVAAAGAARGGVAQSLLASGGVAAAVGIAATRWRQPQRSQRGSVTVKAEADLWQPRLEDWSAGELKAARDRAASMQGPAADYKGPRYEGPASVTAEFINSLISIQEQGVLMPKRDAYLMVLDVISSLRKESTVGDVSIPQGKHLTIVGDLHGQYWDFMNLLKLAGRPSSDAPFVFNGDFVDRGSWSVEVIMTIFAFKLKDPAHVFLNRGNHEMLETNILYGFCGEVGSKYDMGLFDLFSEAFRNLPLCHLVEKKILVLHGGLPGPDPRIWMPGQTHDPTDAIPMMRLADLDEIRKVDRYIEVTPDAYPSSIGPSSDEKDVNDKRTLIDILWSDPRGGDGYGPSYRKGKGVYMFGPDVTKAFITKNNLQCIIRSHEVKSAGFRWDHPQLLTVFSAPNYLDTGNNKGAFLKLTQLSAGSDIDIETVCYDAVPHPDLPPMHWQEHVMTNYPQLTQIMKKKVGSLGFDEFGDSDFEGLMNFDEWEPAEADAFQEAFKFDRYGRELA